MTFILACWYYVISYFTVWIYLIKYHLYFIHYHTMNKIFCAWWHACLLAYKTMSYQLLTAFAFPYRDSTYIYTHIVDLYWPASLMVWAKLQYLWAIWSRFKLHWWTLTEIWAELGTIKSLFDMSWLNQCFMVWHLLKYVIEFENLQ